jgi:hypothetical protein
MTGARAKEPLVDAEAVQTAAPELYGDHRGKFAQG